VKHWLTYASLRFATLVVGLLPLQIAQRLGQWVAMAGSMFMPGRRGMVARHMHRLGVPPEGTARTVRQVFAGYGRYWAEAFWVQPRRRAQIETTTRSTGLDLIREAQVEGRGMIFALPHLGNWEFAGPIGGQLEMELVAVAENLANRRVRDWFVRLRGAMGIGIVLATGQAQVMRELETVLRRNGGVALLCDRDLRGRGVAVEFFGEKTTLPAGPIALGLRTGAPVFPAAAYFDHGGGHHVVILPRLEFPTEPRSQALETGTQAMATALETLIRQAPDQWHLLQPNWPSDRAAG
jgi:phosphatidylinositol dimannoside acyltransferase